MKKIIGLCAAWLLIAVSALGAGRPYFVILFIDDMG